MDDEGIIAPYCDGFPTTCPNPVTVPPAPPHHDGGIRCGCYDDDQPAREAQQDPAQDSADT
jgi:hypothetical protein